MHKASLTLMIFGSVLAFGLSAGPVNAQATRTWVSGVGDDVNPCSRTAPCKTFAGAISKTATAGFINCLDPAGFGAVTITKSITIDCEGVTAGVLVSGTTGIIINAAAGSVVTLRGLDIEGIGTGLRGINFLAGAVLHVERCRISGFNGSPGHGITFAPASGTSELYVSDTTIVNNGLAASGGGIIIQATGSGASRVVLNRVQVNNNTFGVFANGTGTTGSSILHMRDSETSGNTNDGVSAFTNAAVAAVVMDRSSSLNNGGNGVLSQGAGGQVILNSSTVLSNGVGLATVSSGVIRSFGNNALNGNNNNGVAPTLLSPALQ